MRSSYPHPAYSRYTGLLALAAITAILVPLVPAAHADTTLLQEGFDASSTLDDWFVANTSDSADSTYGGWFIADPDLAADTFNAQAGAIDSYAWSNYQAITSGSSGTISTWLITPALTYQNGDVFSFYTRTIDNPADFADRLDVRFSSNGASTNVGTTSSTVGDFVTALTSINPGLTLTGYPGNWTRFDLTMSGLSGPTLGRVAFHYFVPNGGPLGDNSNFIGLDTVSVVRPGVAVVPESGSIALFGAGLVLPMAGLIRRRRRATTV